MSAKELSDGTVVFHRDQRKSAIDRLVLLAIMVSCAAILRTVGAYVLVAPFVIWLVPALLTITRQNTLNISPDSVWWRRRGKVRTIDLHTVRSVDTEAVTTRSRRSTTDYVVLSFRMNDGTPIQSQALFGKAGTPNAAMVSEAVAVIRVRLEEIDRYRMIRTNRDAAEAPVVVTPGRRVFKSSQRYNIQLWVPVVLGLAMSVWLVAVARDAGSRVVFGAMFVMSVYLVTKLTGSLRIVVDDEEMTLYRIGQKRRVRFADLAGVVVEPDVTGFFELSALSLVYPDGRTEPTGAIAGSMWPDEPSGKMVRDAAAVINHRILRPPDGGAGGNRGDDTDS